MSFTFKAVNAMCKVFSEFPTSNGVKQGGVFLPILFFIYTDALLKQLEETGVECHMGSRFTGTLAYADDITLLAPCKSVLPILVSVCEKYASEFDILFNGNKSHFKRKSNFVCLQSSQIII